MKRKSFKLLLPLIIATSIVLSGCGSNNAQDETVTENAEVETTISDVSGDVTNIVETSEEAEEEVVEEAVADSSEEVMEEEQVAEVPNDNASSEPVATTPAENKPEETVPVAETPAPVITDPANDPSAPTGDIPATVTWTYTTLVADSAFSGHTETFTVTTRNPGLHSVEYYQAHPWKLYNEENTDELGTVSFAGWDAGFPGDAWGSLYYEGRYIYNITDDSYLYNFTIRNLDDYNAVSLYQFHQMYP